MMTTSTPLDFQRARQPGQIEQRRAAILEAALALFEAKGLENVSLNDIAKRVGIAKSNLYRYFDSREHIYLRVLQRLAGEWEQRLYPALEKLKGKGTPAKVAAVITEALLQSASYCVLITVINSVLEKNLTPSLVVDFRTVFLECRQRFAGVLSSAMPGVTTAQIYPLVLHIFAHAAGLWPLCHPSTASREMLAQPGFAHLDLDFQTEMRRFLRMLLTSATLPLK